MQTNKLPLISIITVVYNGQKYFEDTILSVINQTYDNVEYIIIDGGSTDGTLDIIRKYENKINYWISEKDNGIYDAMNKGIAVATGEWINFMNAGDMFFDNTILQKMQKELSEDFVYGNHAVYLNHPVQYTIVNVEGYADKRNIPFCHQSLFARTTWLNKFPFDLDYRISGDYDQYLKCKKHNATIKHIPITVSLFLDGGLSSISRQKLIKEYYDITKQYHKYSATFVYWMRILKFKLLGK